MRQTFKRKILNSWIRYKKLFSISYKRQFIQFVCFVSIFLSPVGNIFIVGLADLWDPFPRYNPRFTLALPSCRVPTVARYSQDYYENSAERLQLSSNK